MNTNQPTNHTHNSDGIGLPGQTVIALTVSGGMLLGGFTVALMTLLGRLSGGGLLLSSTGLFLLGSFLGGLHGVALGYLGREPGSDGRRALLSEARSLLYAMPALAVAWPFTSWIAMSAVSRYTGKLDLQILSGLSWLAGLAVLTWAATVAWKAARNAYTRWPERRPGTVLVAATFVALGVLLLGTRPELWGMRLRLTPIAAALTAAAAAIWVVGPLVTLGLRAAGLIGMTWLQQKPVQTSRRANDVVVGLLGGLVVAALVYPFHRDPIGLPNAMSGTTVWHGVALLMSRALFDEAILRVGLASTIFWVAMRAHVGSRATSTVLGVLGAALVQVLVYTPGALAYGFRSDWTTVTYLGAGVLIPALIFGALYVRRGLGPALLADGTALATVAFVATA